ncbi:MAG: right-handed parallel beta-helix repeat-containing protein, partial [Bacteroidia bacterium]|nr:right-handed parallel beta-helix repeat-containing protein [Bacteroidia bacterium]
TGFTILEGSNAVQLTGTNARLDGILLEYGADYPVMVTFELNELANPLENYRYEYVIRSFIENGTIETVGFHFDITIKPPDHFMAEITDSTFVTCFGHCDGSATVTAYGGKPPYTYLWCPAAGSKQTASVTGLCEGVYTVTVTDAEGTTATTSVTITVVNYVGETLLSANTFWDGVNYKINTVVTVPADKTLNISGSTIEFGPAGGLIIEKGGSIIINESVIKGICVDYWDGTIEVKPGGMLQLKTGAIIKMGGSGKILVDANTGDQGLLIYEIGSVINLKDDATMLEIAGNLEIAPNAAFTFTGSGFVKFSSPLYPSANIIAGANSSIILNGSDNSDKVLEITQESFYILANLASFAMNNAKIEMGTGARMQMNGYNTVFSLSNSKMTSSSGSNNNHKGLTLYGQPNITINHCIFEYGKYGIFAFLTYGGSPLTINNSTFRNNNYGLYSHDKGVTLKNCRFNNNQYGWYAQAMSYGSVINNSRFLNNNTGIKYMGASTSSLYIKESDINNNTNNGLEAYGDFLVSILCGSIKNNTNYGIYINEAGLNLSTLQTPAAGKVDLSKNKIAVFADCAKFLYLEKGYNNFTPRHNEPKALTIAGSLSCYNTSQITISAKNNKWGNFTC